MAEQALKRFEELIGAGVQLVPLGGFEFSGYNARLQNKYLDWRKACLEMLELSGPIGFPYKNKILADQNGGYFFQSSAQLILNGMKELYDKLKASPDLAGAPPAQPAQAASAASAATPPAAEAGGARVLKPPPKPAAPQAPPPQAAPTPVPPPAAPAAPAPAAASAPVVGSKVYVVTDEGDPLHAQLSQFLSDIGLEEIVLTRVEGQMLALDSIPDDSSVQFAFFVLNSSDLSFAMFEIGHFVGKLGKGHVSVIHMTDVGFPKNIPGISVRPIVVRLEEASFGLIKELKAAGYKVSI